LRDFSLEGRRRVDAALCAEREPNALVVARELSAEIEVVACDDGCCAQVAELETVAVLRFRAAGILRRLVRQVEIDVFVLVAENGVVAVEVEALQADSADNAVKEVFSFDERALRERVFLVAKTAVELEACVALTLRAPIVSADSELEVLEICLSLDITEG